MQEKINYFFFFVQHLPVKVVNPSTESTNRWTCPQGLVQLVKEGTSILLVTGSTPEESRIGDYASWIRACRWVAAAGSYFKKKKTCSLPSMFPFL